LSWYDLSRRAAAIKPGSPRGNFLSSGGIEFALFWLVVLAAIALRGGGALSLDRKLGKEF
jgi:uncharacterized membrane protein YphA (DoxX/SURF4 family)